MVSAAQRSAGSPFFLRRCDAPRFQESAQKELLPQNRSKSFFVFCFFKFGNLRGEQRIRRVRPAAFRVQAATEPLRWRRFGLLPESRGIPS